MAQHRKRQTSPDGYLAPEFVSRDDSWADPGMLGALREITGWFDRWKLGRIGGWLVVPMLVAVVVFTAGMVLNYNVYMTSSDLRIVQYVGRLHDGIGTTMALVIHAGLGGPFAVVVLLTVAALVLVLKRSATDGLLVVALSTSGWALTSGMKLAVGRARPEPRLLTDVLVPGLNGFTSFPSGHTAFAVSLSIAVTLAAWGTRWRNLTLVSSVLFVMAVGASRVYLGVHYPSDVIASFALSIAAVVLMAGLVTRCGPDIGDWARRRRDRNFPQHHLERGRR